MRENTERPSTINEGTNMLVGRNQHKIVRLIQAILIGKVEEGPDPGEMGWQDCGPDCRDSQEEVQMIAKIIAKTPMPSTH